jgi:hypothetical protein
MSAIIIIIITSGGSKSWMMQGTDVQSKLWDSSGYLQILLQEQDKMI